MPKRPPDYLELDRRFSLLDPKCDSEELALYSYASTGRFSQFGAVGWKSLLEKRGVTVILGEPGSGRTYEFRNQVAQLKSAGSTAFIVELHRLVNQEFSRALDPEELLAFERWKGGQSEAFFFLDAADEAKLGFPSDFEQALRNFRRSFDNNSLANTNIYLSSRIWPWNPETDMQRVREHLCLRSTVTASQNKEEEVKNETGSIPVYLIAPLDADRVGRFARFRNVNDVQAFLDAVDQHHAWEYAGRPYDVDFLLRYWQEHRRLDSLRTMLDQLVTYQLKEGEDKPDSHQMSMQRAREGVELLATASIFCKSLDFRVRDKPGSEAGKALEVDKCLPVDWARGDQDALMDRALFASPHYGRVRFQHRRTSEYLAACWWQNIMPECTVAELRHHFFVQKGARLILRQSRAPVAVWLACLSQEHWALELRQLLLIAAPHAFLRYGDPSQLPLDYKRKIIDAIVERYAGRQFVRIEMEKGAVSRLCDPELAEALSTHLGSSTVSVGLKAEFLKLAISGRAVGCVPVALDLVANRTASREVMSYGIWLVEELGTTEQKRRLLAIANELPSIPSALCGQFVHALFPDFISATELGDLLRKVEDSPSAGHDLPWRILLKVDQLRLDHDVGPLLRTLLDLFQQPPLQDESSVSVSFMWLGKTIARLLTRLLSATQLDADSSMLGAQALWLLTQDCFRGERLFAENSNEGRVLNEATARHLAVRELAFWLRIKQELEGRPNRGEALEYLARDVFENRLGFICTPDDLTWAIRFVSSREDVARREVAFHLAYLLWVQGDRSYLKLSELSSAIADLPHLCKTLTRYRWQTSFSWLLRWWHHHRLRGWFAAWWWDERWRRSNQFGRKVAARWRLQKACGI